MILSAQIHREDLDRLTSEWIDCTNRIEAEIGDQMRHAQDRAYACGYRRGAEAKKAVENTRDELLAELERIASGQEMTGEFTHADTVLRYQEIARAAIRKATP